MSGEAKFNEITDIIHRVPLLVVITGVIIFIISFAGKIIISSRQYYWVLHIVNITCAKIYCIVKKYVGCVGALRENLCLLRVYSISMLLIFLGKLAMVGVGYYFGDQVRIVLENTFGPKVIESYRENDDFTNLVDTVQEYFECCGMSTDGYR